MSDSILFDRPFIGYDGSKNCHDLITVFKKLHPKLQQSTFAFVYDPIKNFIPPAAKGPGIKKQLQQKLQGLSNIEIKIIEKQQSQQRSTNDHILDQFLKSKSTFLMLGFYGSKGEKVRSIDLSSRVRTFVYDSKAIVAIIKRQQSNDKGDNVLFCCDGSEISYQGLKKASIFCKKFGFNLTVLHTFNQQTKAYSKQVKGELKSLQDSGKLIKFETVIQKADLIQYLQSKSQNFEWIIVTKNGYRGEISKKVFIGSNTTQILTKIICNLLIL